MFMTLDKVKFVAKETRKKNLHTINWYYFFGRCSLPYFYVCMKMPVHFWIMYYDPQSSPKGRDYLPPLLKMCLKQALHYDWGFYATIFPIYLQVSSHNLISFQLLGEIYVSTCIYEKMYTFWTSLYKLWLNHIHFIFIPSTILFPLHT